jgi:outer membrane protein assembly factor BamB
MWPSKAVAENSLMPGYRILVGGAVGLVLISLALGAAADDKAKHLAKPGVTSAASAKELSRNWPGFRGPNGVGHARHANPPLEWSAKEGVNIRWKVAIPKHGMSSPIVWGDRVFVTTADEESRLLYCVDANSGKVLWQHEVNGVPGSPDDGKLPEVLEDTGYAAPTPTTNGQYVAAVFGTGELVCVTMEGKRVWLKHLGIPHNHYGHASSLVCHGNLLFVQYDQSKNSQLLAFDLASGKPAWQAKRDAISWSSPILAENKGRMDLILTNSKAVEGYDPASGKSLWRVECLNGEVASSAAYANGKVFVANDGALASAIDVGNPDRPTLWQWEGALPDAASPVANESYLIIPTSFGAITCLDVKTGTALWEHEFDQGFSSSPILVNDRVYILDVAGRMQIFRMDDEFELLGVAEIGEPVYATPAFVGERVYVRSLAHLFCIQANTKLRSARGD